MSKWFTNAATTPRFQYPNEIFVRFVARNYYPAPFRSDIKFLELGSGSGADLKFLEQQGFDALGVDSGQFAHAHYHCDFSAFPWDRFDNHFDCIYELNVLCHVQDAPYKEIAAALKPNGKFFAIMPALDTEADLEGKGYTRLSSPSDIGADLDPYFSKIDIRPSCYPHRQRNHINWVVEADK